MAEEVRPPAEIYCQLCHDGGGIADHCYQTDVTRTGVQLHCYHCRGCDRWLTVRWSPDRPAQHILANVSKVKPRQVRAG